MGGERWFWWCYCCIVAGKKALESSGLGGDKLSTRVGGRSDRDRDVLELVLFTFVMFSESRPLLAVCGDSSGVEILDIVCHLHHQVQFSDRCCATS
ncbi:hypothetical protein HA466_0019590 [Hirschfeldia incana]|nr:hypothetical protein HA466_0019590 [Hirschfeldia incana]